MVGGGLKVENAVALQGLARVATDYGCGALPSNAEGIERRMEIERELWGERGRRRERKRGAATVALLWWSVEGRQRRRMMDRVVVHLREMEREEERRCYPQLPRSLML